MSQLVRPPSPWLAMILIPRGGSVGRALQRVPIAALWLERSFEWLVFPEARLCGCSGPGHQRADEVRIDRCNLHPKPLSGGRCFPNLNQAPPLARDRAKISSANRLSARFKLLSRGGKAFPSRKVRQTAGLRRFSKSLSCNCRSA